MPKAKSRSTEDSQKQVQVHRCRFVEWIPSGIVSLAFNKANTRLAVARENGNIEFWNVVENWFCERVIQGSGKRLVESVLWHPVEGSKQERFFSVGMNGFLIEWDLLTLLPKSNSDSCGGGAIHSACLKQKQGGAVADATPGEGEEYWTSTATIALGCHDGSIRLFDVSDEQAGLVYVRSLQRHTGPVLSVCWKGDMLVSSGADGHIRVWNTKTGALTSRITVDSYTKAEPTLVWQVKILQNGMIVSGDSLGHVQFWDAEFGTLAQSFVPFQADVLALAEAPNGAVYASGVDPLMTEFKCVEQQDKPGKWVVTALHRSHSHDVNAIVIAANINSSTTSQAQSSNCMVVSGGRDSQLCSFLASKTKHGNPTKTLPFVDRSCVSVAARRPQADDDGERKPARFLLRNGRLLQLFQIGTPEATDQEKTDGKQGTAVPTSSYHHLVDIKTDSASEGGLNLSCCALSDDSQWAAGSDPVSLKLYRFRQSKGDDTNTKIRTKRVQCPAALPPAHALCFTKDSKRLAVGAMDSSIQILDLSTNTVVATFHDYQSSKGRYADADEEDDGDLENQAGTGLLNFLCVSEDNKWLAACDHRNRINIYNLRTLKHECSLPTPSSAPTALAFHPKEPVLVVVCASNEFFLFDFVKQGFSDWSRENGASIPRRLTSQKDKIFGVTFDWVHPERMFLLATSFICKVDLSKPINKTDELERPKKMARLGKAATGASNADDTPVDSNFRIIKDFTPLLGGKFVSEDELLLVEMPWIKALESFPPTFERKKYGT